MGHIGFSNYDSKRTEKLIDIKLLELQLMEYKLLEEQDLELMLDFGDDENTKYSVYVLKRFIDDKNNFGFIAKTDNKIVGFAFGYILLYPDGRKVFYLHAIDVMPEYQGKGYGTGLISFSRDYAKTIKCFKMYLITNKSNISACKCYEKAGGINKADDEIVYVYDFR